jgi:hypothetical protein
MSAPQRLYSGFGATAPPDAAGEHVTYGIPKPNYQLLTGDAVLVGDGAPRRSNADYAAAVSRLLNPSRGPRLSHTAARKVLAAAPGAHRTDAKYAAAVSRLINAKRGPRMSRAMARKVLAGRGVFDVIGKVTNEFTNPESKLRGELLPALGNEFANPDSVLRSSYVPAAAAGGDTLAKGAATAGGLLAAASASGGVAGSLAAAATAAGLGTALPYVAAIGVAGVGIGVVNNAIKAVQQGQASPAQAAAEIVDFYNDNKDVIQHAQQQKGVQQTQAPSKAAAQSAPGMPDAAPTLFNSLASGGPRMMESPGGYAPGGFSSSPPSGSGPFGNSGVDLAGVPWGYRPPASRSFEPMTKSGNGRKRGPKGAAYSKAVKKRGGSAVYRAAKGLYNVMRGQPYYGAEFHDKYVEPGRAKYS